MWSGAAVSNYGDLSTFNNLNTRNTQHVRSSGFGISLLGPVEATVVVLVGGFSDKGECG